MERALPLRARWGQTLPVAVLGASIVALDQATKFAVRANLAVGESFPDWPVRFTRVNNTGSAFGLFADQTLFLIVASVVAIGVILYFYRQLAATSALLRASLGMQLGGAVSNLADRVRDGHVTDFVDFQFWPVFNVADSSVVIGIGLLAWVIIVRERGAQNGQ